MKAIRTTYRRLLQGYEYPKKRYLYRDFSLEERLTGLIGARGTGRTTLLIQYIKEHFDDPNSCIYASLDHIYFQRTPVLELIESLYEYERVRYFFFDEVHTYPSWAQELKNAYDSFPDIRIVYSGSSSIDLVQGAYDLSRRSVLYHLRGLSFREYLLFKGIADIAPVTLEEILTDRGRLEKDLGNVEGLLGYFKDYLRCGYYPFFLEGEGTYRQKLLRVIDKTIYEDISNFYKLKTENLIHLKRILAFLATIPPGELNRNSISRHLGIDNKTVESYLHILQETGLVQLVREDQGGSALLKQKEKIFLANSDLYHTICEETGFEASVGTLREVFFMRMVENSGHHAFYVRQGDYLVANTLFEIGGRNKTLKQVSHALPHAFLVKDDIRIGGRHEIPLHYFGFLY